MSGSKKDHNGRKKRVAVIEDMQPGTPLLPLHPSQAALDNNRGKKAKRIYEQQQKLINALADHTNPDIRLKARMMQSLFINHKAGQQIPTDVAIKYKNDLAELTSQMHQRANIMMGDIKDKYPFIYNKFHEMYSNLSPVSDLKAQDLAILVNLDNILTLVITNGDRFSQFENHLEVLSHLLDSHLISQDLKKDIESYKSEIDKLNIKDLVNQFNNVDKQINKFFLRIDIELKERLAVLVDIKSVYQDKQEIVQCCSVINIDFQLVKDSKYTDVDRLLSVKSKLNELEITITQDVRLLVKQYQSRDTFSSKILASEFQRLQMDNPIDLKKIIELRKLIVQASTDINHPINQIDKLYSKCEALGVFADNTEALTEIKAFFNKSTIAEMLQILENQKTLNQQNAFDEILDEYKLTLFRRNIAVDSSLRFELVDNKHLFDLPSQKLKQWLKTKFDSIKKYNELIKINELFRFKNRREHHLQLFPLMMNEVAIDPRDLLDFNQFVKKYPNLKSLYNVTSIHQFLTIAARIDAGTLAKIENFVSKLDAFDAELKKLSQELEQLKNNPAIQQLGGFEYGGNRYQSEELLQSYQNYYKAGCDLTLCLETGMPLASSEGNITITDAYQRYKKSKREFEVGISNYQQPLVVNILPSAHKDDNASAHTDSLSSQIIKFNNFVEGLAPGMGLKKYERKNKFQKNSPEEWDDFYHHVHKQSNILVVRQILIKYNIKDDKGITAFFCILALHVISVLPLIHDFSLLRDSNTDKSVVEARELREQIRGVRDSLSSNEAPPIKK